VTSRSVAGFIERVDGSPSLSSHMTKHRPLAAKTVVLTGKLADGLTRDAAESRLRSWGASMESSVTWATDVLLATDPARRTKKRTDADRYRVEVMDESTFVATVLMPLIPTVRIKAATTVLPLIPGDRVALVRMEDDPDPIPVGMEGIVSTVNFDARQAWVTWDNGRTLAIVLGQDEVRLV
jgi:hypothetical protein